MPSQTSSSTSLPRKNILTIEKSTLIFQDKKTQMSIRSVAVSNNNKFFVCASDNHAALVFDSESFQLIHKLVGREVPFLEEAEKYYSSSNENKKQQQEKKVEETSSSSSSLINEEESEEENISAETSLQRYNDDAYRCRTTMFSPKHRYKMFEDQKGFHNEFGKLHCGCSCVAISPTNEFIACGTDSPTTVDSEHSFHVVFVWKTNFFSTSNTNTNNNNGDSSSSSSKFTPCSNFFIPCYRLFSFHSSTVRGINFAPTNRFLLAAVSDDNQVSVWTEHSSLVEENADKEEFDKLMELSKHFGTMEQKQKLLKKSAAASSSSSSSRVEGEAENNLSPCLPFKSFSEFDEARKKHNEFQIQSSCWSNKLNCGQNSCCWSLSSEVLAVGGDDAAISIYDMRNIIEFEKRKEQETQNKTLSLTETELTESATTTKTKTKNSSIETTICDKLRTLSPHRRRVWALCCVPHTGHLLSASDDGSWCAYDKTWSAVGTDAFWGNNKKPVTFVSDAHTSTCRGICCLSSSASSSSSSVAVYTCSWEKAAKVWNLESGKLISSSSSSNKNSNSSSDSNKKEEKQKQVDEKKPTPKQYRGRKVEEGEEGSILEGKDAMYGVGILQQGKFVVTTECSGFIQIHPNPFREYKWNFRKQVFLISKFSNDEKIFSAFDIYNVLVNTCLYIA